MLATSVQDHPLGVQLLGCEPRFILRAIEILNKRKFDLLDFNAACPAKKVVRRGEGAALLKDPEKLKELLKLLVNNSRYPVTLKIRTGWDRDTLNAREVAMMAEDVGVKALFIHGRTKLQGYSGAVDYDVIREVKQAIKIPVIASGDNLCAELIKKMFDQTGCDGAVIARGALGNPWIFKQAKEFLQGGKIKTKPTIPEVVSVMLEHLEMHAHFYGERVGVVKYRKFFAWYTKGFRKIRPFREKSSRVKTLEGMREIIQLANG